MYSAWQTMILNPKFLTISFLGISRNIKTILQRLLKTEFTSRKQSDLSKKILSVSTCTAIKLGIWLMGSSSTTGALNTVRICLSRVINMYSDPLLSSKTHGGWITLHVNA